VLLSRGAWLSKQAAWGRGSLGAAWGRGGGIYQLVINRVMELQLA